MPVFISMASYQPLSPAARPSRLGATDPSNSDILNDGDGGVWVCGICGCVQAFVRVRAHARACVRACIRSCVHVCVRACVCA